MENLWVNKYKSKVLSDIVGNKKQITQIKDWLVNINNFKSKAIIVSGVHGIGKSLTIKLLLDELNYLVRIIYPNEIKDHRIFDDFNDYYNHQNSIYSKINFNDNKNKKLILIFEETENITLTSEKKYIMDIFKENNKLKSFPIIFISNNQHSKLLNDLKKNCDEIKFECPTLTELHELVNRICINENIKIKDNNVLNEIIAFSQYDIRRLINLLQELSFHYKYIDQQNLDIFIEKSREKNIDTCLFDATRTILNNYLEYDTIIKLYEYEKVLLPLMIHENYLHKVLYKNNIEPWNDTIYSLVKISDSISRGDNIETSIYTDQNWYLQNIHGFYTCLNTSYWINKHNKKYKIDNKYIKFSSDLNKTSLKNINRKNISNLLKFFPNKSIYDILILNKISNHLLTNNKEKELIDILTTYSKDFTVKEIELCLKIDKTCDFNLLNSKDKKRISKQIKV
jgi:DNA polymerase III delta prime subunit